MNTKSKMRKTTLAMVPELSPIYKFHPFTRLVFFIITGFIPLFIDLPELNLLFIFAIIILFLVSKIDLSSLKIYAPMMVTVGFFIFFTYIFFPGNVEHATKIGTVFGIKLYYEPLRWAFASYCRILALILSSIFYFSTNRERDILAGLRTAKLPFLASYFIGVSLRSASMFLEDLKIIREAEQARGLDYSTLKLTDKVKLYSMYMIPLFTISLRRGDEISNALYVKGFSFQWKGKRPDYILTKYNMQRLDKLIIVLLVALLLAVIYVKFTTNYFNINHSILNSLL